MIRTTFNGKQLVYLVMALGLTGLCSQCKKEALDVYECATVSGLTFDDHIFPILDLHCRNGSCHGRFDDYDKVKKFVDNDKLLGSIQHKDGYSNMPKDSDKLADSLIITISCWIQDGARKN